MNEQLAEFVRALSTLFGWLYVYSWSASFYPQPLLNWRRKSTEGLTVDFPALNVLGFVSYTVSTASFLFSTKIRRQYASRHPDAPEPTVRFNDFAFAAHATILVLLTYSQFFTSLWPFNVSEKRRMNLATRSVIATSILAVLIAIAKAAMNDGQEDTSVTRWTWIDVVYIFGYIKLLATFMKYVPQVLHNYQRQSTRGWSIGQIQFDFAGGILSLAQLLIDSSFQGDWSGITGNPSKFGLSNISLMFDAMFITQHYLWYPNAKPVEDDDDAHQPLLHEN